MASGTIYGSTGDSNWTFKIDWSESDTSIANNTTKVTAKVYLGRSSTQSYLGGNYSVTININGSSGTYSGNVPYPTYVNGGAWLYLKERAVTVTHNANGTKSCSISASMSSSDFWPNSCSASGTATLSTIPRYATCTQSLSSATETTATMAWSSDSTCDALWYSTDNGTNWAQVTIADSKSGTYTISSLSAGTAYNIKTRVRRKDSQLTTDSTALEVTTYSYPYANSMPNFTIGNALTVGLYNPLGRSVTVYMVGANNAEKSGGTATGTSISPFNNSTWVNWFYDTIPNAQSGTYKIKVVYGSHTETRTGGTYSVNASACSPSIGTCTYQDTKASVVAITGNNQHIVRNQSIVQYTANSLSAQKSATVSSCKVVVNGQTYNLTISGSTATGGNAVINSGTNVNAVFTVTDSRGLTASKTVAITMKNWSNPTGIITIQRHDNFYTETDIKCDAQYANIGTNAIVITYSAVRDGGGSTITGTLADNVTSVVNLDNNYAWDITITLVDSFGGTTTYTVHLSRGMPIIYFDRIKSSVGINCFPENQTSFEVVGVDHTISADEYLELARLLASDFSTSATYFVGEFCRYNSKIWECKTAITSGGTWNASKWIELGGA